MKSLIWVVVVFIVIVGALVIFNGSSSSSSQFSLTEVSPSDHVKGRTVDTGASSTVVLIEYADFQCPACRSYYPILLELSQTYSDKVTFVYRHFPLKQIHFNAEPAAWASEAASKQGKFWEMHNLLFEKQNEWSSASDLKKVFGDYAVLIGIDKEQFLADLDSGEVKDIVKSQRESAVKNGFNASPTFVLNGEKLDSPQSIQAFKLLIDKALK